MCAAVACDVLALTEILCATRKAAELFVSLFGGAPAAVPRAAFLALGEASLRAHLRAVGWEAHNAALFAWAVDHRALQLPRLAQQAGLRLDFGVAAAPRVAVTRVGGDDDDDDPAGPFDPFKARAAT